jgi:DNA-binding response OmpR family regulator
MRVYNLRPDVKARQRVHLRTYMARRKGASIKIASRRWSGIRIVRALTRGKRRKLSLLINGEPVKTSETVAALVACLYGHLGQMVPYNQLGPAIGYRRAGSLQRPVLRQYVYVVERLLAKHKAPYVITVARDVGYALCPIARRTIA